MYCNKCRKYHEGYRCPYCGDFVLDDPSIKGKKISLYHKEITREKIRMIPLYIFLALFVGGWLFVVAYFTGK